MEPGRPLKRIRQACEQCRRKKSKCSGQKPVCGTCWRLGQQCYYFGEPLQHVRQDSVDTQNLMAAPDLLTPAQSGAHDWSERLVALESNMDRILNTLQSTGAANNATDPHLSSPIHPSTHGSSYDVRTPNPRLTAMIGDQSGSGHIRQLRKKEIDVIGHTYLSFCDCQPLLLFPRDTFIASLSERSDSTLFAIISVSLRHTRDTDAGAHQRDAYLFRNAAHSLIIGDIGRGDVSVETLQTLCLIIFFEYSDGDTKKALSLIALASMLAQGVDFRTDPTSTSLAMTDEYNYCYWSIELLRRLLGVTTEPGMVTSTKLLPYPLSCSKPTGSALRESFKKDYERNTDNGIMDFVFEMSEEWVKVMAYVRNVLSFTADVSPWLTNSKYSTTMAGIMSIECRLQPLHRYTHIAFRELTLQDLEICREYWAPWLLSRFLYHTLVCLLNHPLLIILQLQAHGNDSELFREQASFYVARHVHWILHFIAFIEERRFRITDPILGYCAAVVATIELQLIYSVDEATTEKKRRNIDSCRRLIRSLATSFPIMAETDRKLEALVEVMLSTYASNTSRSRSMTVDLSQIKDILDICPVPHGIVSNGINNTGPAPPITSLTDASPSQWVRLSRRPSVDQPDEGESPAQVHKSPQPTPGGLGVTSIIEPIDVPAHPAPFATDPTAPVGRPALTADVFFNGISQDMSSWWSAFDSYDPDGPGF